MKLPSRSIPPILRKLTSDANGDSRASGPSFRLTTLRCLIGLLGCYGILVSGFVPLSVASDPAPELARVEAQLQEVTFERDIQPLLTRYGCNAGPCHGKSRGQNGFALSLLGFDSDFDYDALVHQGRGRRVSLASPDESLLLQKALGKVPHGGGLRFELDSKPHELMRQWLAGGAARTPADAPQLVRVAVEPSMVSLAPESESLLHVWAHYTDGTRSDVTAASAFQSNSGAIAAVDEHGVVRAGPVPGEAAVMARYRNHIAVSRVTIPLPGSVADATYEALPQTHPLDVLVWEKLKLLGMLPSTVADDATFHRRAYLRVIGRLPTPDETREFLASTNPQKRHELVDRLLERPEYADFWANKWADLLRPNPY